ncbi:uncharacterized protein LOC120252166 [Dioscorea cayenensis subsp. rotundata]|uniref:Uncharacterized protein LOC120252166 n=1 Tax=Dioscorea cayennensis subsp. rotundata TaxID=55577 RepID=A0AB40ANI5_DIOCR|nr:uncharacterized protein LOC120252166 [Dioscorea cayenensis subsp. rotundata]
MWTISDFPAYSMLSGWSTAGKLACPYCMEDSDAFTLTKGGKTSWFDNHSKFLQPNHPYRRNKKWFLKGKLVKKATPQVKSGIQILEEIESFGLQKITEIDGEEINSDIKKHCNKRGWKKRSIFWDLPYRKTILIRHNLDVMHIEKNCFDNIFNTVMNVSGKSKDNAKSREDLKEFCDRPELHMDERTKRFPKACYILDRKQKEELCNWLKELKFPDGYVLNMDRCVDQRRLKLFGMKSHDCHVFMQRLIPIAFRELLPPNVCEALTELSIFFKDLTARVIKDEDMKRLEWEIPIILCNFERIFPPSFFDCMEHLPVHLAYEARIAGPVQYRWMYLRRLKNNVKNKAHVEGSICNAYLVKEISSFCAHYFDSHICTRHRKVGRNDDNINFDMQAYPGILSIFKPSGTHLGPEKKRRLDEKEYHAARTYVLLNCDEVQPYIKQYEEWLRANQPNIQDHEVDHLLETKFALWFDNYAHHPSSGIMNEWLKCLASKPMHKVKTYNGYCVNGYKFHTENRGYSKSTMNSGVCIKGSNLCASELEYFGKLVEVVKLEYEGWPMKEVVLFKCTWFDPTLRIGTRIHPRYKLIDVHKNKAFNKYEPFILATQAAQVFYSPYPSLRKSCNDWLAVCAIKARSIVEVAGTQAPSICNAFQEDEVQVHEIENHDEELSLNSSDGAFIEIDGMDIDEEVSQEGEVSEEDDEDEEEEDEVAVFYDEDGY